MVPIPKVSSLRQSHRCRLHKVHALREALLRGRNRPRNVGAGSPTTFRGDGYEFVELREYVNGDDPRRIDWAATARVGALQTRVVLEDVALTLAAIVDDSGSMHVGRRRSMLVGAREALHAWYGAAQSDDRCARVAPEGVLSPLDLRGQRSARACLHEGAIPTPGATFDLIRAFDVARAALPIGAAILVLSDFFDLDRGADTVLAAMARRFDCTALCAVDPWRGAFPLRGFARLADAETGAARTIFFGRRERTLYATAVRDRWAALNARLRHCGWRTQTFDESDGARALYRAFGLPA